jgi:hypothetical protein
MQTWQPCELWLGTYTSAIQYMVSKFCVILYLRKLCIFSLLVFVNHRTSTRPNEISTYPSVGGDIWLTIGDRNVKLYMKIGCEHAFKFLTKQNLHITFVDMETMLIFEVKFDQFKVIEICASQITRNNESLNCTCRNINIWFPLDCLIGSARHILF